MSLLTWRGAGRQDKLAIKGFACTQEGRKTHGHGGWYVDHPAEHERAVQSRIRDKLKPPRQPPAYALLGWQADTLGAVVAFTHLDGPAVVNVDAIAVALFLRQCGGEAARETLDVALNEMTHAAVDDAVPEVLVTAQIHRDNIPCQRLFEEFDFGPREGLTEGLVQWAMTFPVAGAQ